MEIIPNPTATELLRMAMDPAHYAELRRDAGTDVRIVQVPNSEALHLLVAADGTRHGLSFFAPQVARALTVLLGPSRRSFDRSTPKRLLWITAFELCPRYVAALVAMIAAEYELNIYVRTVGEHYAEPAPGGTSFWLLHAASDDLSAEVGRGCMQLP